MNIKSYRIIFLLIGALVFQNIINAQSKIDSVEFYLSKSNDFKKYNINSRLIAAKKAKTLSDILRIDSLIIKCNINLSQLHLEQGNDSLFLKSSWQNLILAEKIKDSLSLVKTNKNLGDYYKNNQITDSSYYYYHKADKIYRALKDDFNLAITLLSIAIIQKNEKDFTGSEVTSVEAISILNQLEDTNDVVKAKAFIYNNLGAVFDQLEQYDESIKYHKKAIELKKKLKGDNQATIDNSLNNIATAYKNSHQYKTATRYYNQILENENLINERPEFYALVLDNYAHTMFLSQNFGQLPALYLKALRICDSLDSENANYNVIGINLDLAEYYNHIHKKDSAKYYAHQAKNIAEHYHNDDLLRSLLMLTKIEDDSMAVKYYKDYIKLNDSLVKNERTIRNKFARIRFETQEIEQKNIQIAKERMWLIVLSITLLVTAFLIYIIITQRSKNSELKFVQKQQETNEEIYNLLLSQQERIEEARTLEKKNISQELHDGVLGRLFGTRLSLDSLNMGTSQEAIETRSRYIQDLKIIEEDIRKVSHELNTDFISGSGFLDIIKTLLETQTTAYGLDYTFDYNDSINWDDISNKNKIHIYRILQETLHNIYKHAHATVVKISFELKNNVICLSIEDNGSGFDVNKAKTGIGLKNIRARVKEIKGDIDIMSEKGLGTTVKIHVPV